MMRRVPSLRSQRGFLLNPYSFGSSEAGPPDPYFANVVLLLHAEGANDSTTIIDSSSTAKTVSASGGMKISTAQSLAGAGSMVFDGTSSYGVVPASADMAFSTTDDFCFEFALRPSLSPNSREVMKWYSASTSDGVGISSTGKVHLWKDGIGEVVASTTTLVVNTWYRIAIARVSGVVRLFVEGNVESSAASVSAFGAGYSFHLGEGFYNGKFAGHMDEVRITKGQGRYTANYTPEAGPFPNSA